jgi:hypothetical protein
MAKRKLSPTVAPNTLETMIEYTLISNILDKICEMPKKLLEYPKYDTKLDPLQHLFKIRTWGPKWKRVCDKIDKWVAW